MDSNEVFYQIVAVAQDYFKQYLHLPLGSLALKYLQDRGFTPEMIEQWGMGFAVNDWTALNEYFKQFSFTEEQLGQAGLIIWNEEKKSYYDHFRNRVIYTIKDRKGRPCGFSGRVLDSTQPKYLNSPESPIYLKNQLLYGWSDAKESIFQQNKALVVEGYMDAIACHSSGIINTIASMGTSMSADQVRLLRRYCENAYLCYDMDVAGKTASLKVIDVLSKEGLNVYRVLLPEGFKDVDELVSKGHKDLLDISIKDASLVRLAYES